MALGKCLKRHFVVRLFLWEMTLTPSSGSVLKTIPIALNVSTLMWQHHKVIAFVIVKHMRNCKFILV